MTWSSDWIATSLAPLPEKVGVVPDTWSPDEVAAQPMPPAPGEALRGVGERREADRRAALERQAELEEAYQRGFDEGAAETMQRQAAGVRSALGALASVMEQLSAGEGTWVDNARENICALAVAVAKQLVGRELTGDAHIVADLTRRALAQFPVDEPLRVRLHPQDLSMTLRHSRGWRQHLDRTGARSRAGSPTPTSSRAAAWSKGRHRVIDGRVDHGWNASTTGWSMVESLIRRWRASTRFHWPRPHDARGRARHRGLGHGRGTGRAVPCARDARRVTRCSPKSSASTSAACC